MIRKFVLLALYFYLPLSPVLGSSNFTRYSENPILKAGPSVWDSKGVTNSTVLRNNDIYYMWYVGSDDNYTRIGLATSSSGLMWSKNPSNPVISASSNNENLNEPSVLFSDGLFRMWVNSYEKTTAHQSIKYTTSSDGINWQPLISAIEKTQPWEINAVVHPDVIVENNIYRIYYNGNSNDIWRIGTATSSNGYSWTKYPLNPIFEPTGNESPTVGAPSIVSDSTWYLMFYHSNNPPTKINYAYSNDGIAWSRGSENPILAPVPNSFDSTFMISPSVIWKDNVFKMWYTGYDGSHWSIGYASASADFFPFITPTPPPTTKVVVIPGFGASWNPTAILSCGLSDDDDGEWTLNPAAADIYNPLLMSLEDAGFTPQPFYYDWRKYASVSAIKLSDVLGDSGLATGEKIHLVGHSMGGLVGRAYLEQEALNNELDKFLAVGSPQKGSVLAYPTWSGGEIWEDKLLRKIMFTLILKHCGGLGGNDRETIQATIPSIQQFLPTFDYLRNQPTNALKPVANMAAQNGWLENAFPSFFDVTVGSLYGTGQRTLNEITVRDRNRRDEMLGNWEDGRPTNRGYTLDGDDSVLSLSSMIDGAENIPLNQTHEGLVASGEGIGEILGFLGVLGGASLEVPAYTEPISALIVIADPASFLIIDPDGKLHKDSQEMAAFLNPKKGPYKLLLQPKTASTLVIVGQFLPNGKVLWKEYTFKNIFPKFGTLNFDPGNPQEDVLK